MYGNTFRQVLNDTAQRLRDRQNSPAGLVRINAPDAILLSNNAETLVNAALKGADIVLMPDWQAGELLRQKRFIRLLPEWQAGVSQEKALLPWSIPGRGLSR
ncbi:hypothetical protein GCM10009413_14240 [Tatumella punctata]